jgi:hypothetical protein
VPAPPTVSKTEYSAQVGQMKTLLTSNKVEDAQKKFEDVHKMMLNTLAITKSKMREANDAHNQEEMKKLTDHMIKQRDLYSQILQLVRGDMASNKAKLDEKLKEFGATIL